MKNHHVTCFLSVALVVLGLGSPARSQTLENFTNSSSAVSQNIFTYYNDGNYVGVNGSSYFPSTDSFTLTQTTGGGVNGTSGYVTTNMINGAGNSNFDSTLNSSLNYSQIFGLTQDGLQFSVDLKNNSAQNIYLQFYISVDNYSVWATPIVEFQANSGWTTFTSPLTAANMTQETFGDTNTSSLADTRAGAQQLGILFYSDAAGADLGATDATGTIDITNLGTETTSVPEPTTLPMLGLGLAGVVVLARRKLKKQPRLS